MANLTIDVADCVRMNGVFKGFLHFSLVSMRRM
jgi:hypothetical protein